MTKTNESLVAYAKSKLQVPTIYMLGGFGRFLTQANIDRRVEMGCAHTIRNLATIKAGIGEACFDCVGLMKGYLWEVTPGRTGYNSPIGSDQNVKGMYNSAIKKGSMESMPDTLGLLVFTADFGHVGLYVGKNAQGIRQYIESTPAWGAWGVTTSADKGHAQGHNRLWAYWGQHHLIDYIIRPVTPIPTPIPKPTTNYTYYPKCPYTGGSLVDGLKSISAYKIGMGAGLAKLNEITNYTGSADQNTELLDLLKAGRLVKAVGIVVAPIPVKKPIVLPTKPVAVKPSPFYPVPHYGGSSIVDGLKAVGVKPTWFACLSIAKANSISWYRGTAEQNTKMLNLLKHGLLRRP